MDIREKIADLQHDQRIRRGNENYLLLAPKEFAKPPFKISKRMEKVKEVM